MMPSDSTDSPWRLPLVRELAVILVVKLIVLLGIRAVWFDAPTVPQDATQQVSARLLGTSEAPHLPLTKEEPR